MFTHCKEKQSQVVALFKDCQTREEKYEKIIELGRKQSPLALEDRSEANIVKGCQSTLYLKTTHENNQLFFQTGSDALISAGLAYLLTLAYNGEEPETILKCPPTFIEALDLVSSLSPNRANGLHSLHLRMQQEALKCLVTN